MVGVLAQDFGAERTAICHPYLLRKQLQFVFSDL
jgi:hypothetical protein